MQGLADGYFVIPYTIGNHLAQIAPGQVTTDHPAFKEAEEAVQAQTKRLLSIKGKRSAESFHRDLGKVIWGECGMSRTKEGLESALQRIPEIREEFWQNVSVPGSGDHLNQSLETAGRVADFLEFGEMMIRDALTREESCGGHFRAEHQTPEGEAKRNDEEFSHSAVWEYTGYGNVPNRHKEELEFKYVLPSQRSYK
jgi:succinate dehydrogenase / fumarate reductase flavoprotein subunit